MAEAVFHSRPAGEGVTLGSSIPDEIRKFRAGEPIPARLSATRPYRVWLFERSSDGSLRTLAAAVAVSPESPVMLPALRAHLPLGIATIRLVAIPADRPTPPEGPLDLSDAVVVDRVVEVVQP